MRILHTSDWHLGRSLHGVDLLSHQAAYLNHLVELVNTERVDAVLVSGDIYDRAIPPVDAVNLLSSTLRELSELTTVIVTSGNHDSAIRLGFGAGLMRESLNLRTAIAQVGEPITITSATSGEELLVYALPYLDPDAARGHWLREDSDLDLARSHESVMTHAMNLVRADLAARGAASSVVMAHAFVTGGAASDSERDIRVGGVENVPAGVFAGITYGALGHLHGPQRISFSSPDAVAAPSSSTSASSGSPISLPDAARSPLLRYSGSPLAYSFSEMNHNKSTVLLDVHRGEIREEQLIPAPVARRLSEVRGSFQQVVGTLGEAKREDWTRIIVTDSQRPQDLITRIKTIFPHALQIMHQPQDRVAREHIAIVSAASNPVQITSQFFEHVTGAQPSEAEAEVIRHAVESVQQAERSA